MKQYGQYERVLRKRAARNLLINHTHLCSSVPSYIPKLFVVQFLSRIQHFASTWTAARRLPCPSPSPRACSNSGSLYIESVMPSNHLVLCRSLLFLLSIFPSIRVFSNESALCIRWPKYWSFSFIISTSNEYSELISFRIDWFDLLAVQGTLKSLIQHHSSKASMIWHSAIFMVQISHPYMTTGKTIALTIQTSVGKLRSLLFICCLGLS